MIAIRPTRAADCFHTLGVWYLHATLYTTWRWRRRRRRRSRGRRRGRRRYRRGRLLWGAVSWRWRMVKNYCFLTSCLLCSYKKHELVFVLSSATQSRFGVCVVTLPQCSFFFLNRYNAAVMRVLDRTGTMLSGGKTANTVFFHSSCPLLLVSSLFSKTLHFLSSKTGDRIRSAVRRLRQHRVRKTGRH